MMLPIRCFSCGRPIAQHWDAYRKAIESGEDAGKALDKLGVKPYCCRRMFAGHKEAIDSLLQYQI